MVSLETLESRYLEAKQAFQDDRTEENYVAFKKAKKAFADARVSERQGEEADPDHPRGNVFAMVVQTGEGDDE